MPCGISGWLIFLGPTTFRKDHKDMSSEVKTAIAWPNDMQTLHVLRGQHAPLSIMYTVRTDIFPTAL